MKIVRIDPGIELVAPSVGRSGGVHISDLYNALYARLEPKRYDKGDGPNPVKLAMGLAWERYLEQRLIDCGINCERPPEQATGEGIAFSPDLVIVNGADRIGEMKLTWMSEADAMVDPKFSKWHAQAMAYCRQYRLKGARFYVLFVNGNYRENREPSLQAFDIDYTKQELDENWSALINHGRHEGLLK